MKRETSTEPTEVRIKKVRNSVSAAAVERPLKEESEKSSYSSYESSDDEDDLDAPEVGKEIKSEPQGKGKSLSQERPRSTGSTVRLEPWKERTTTTEKMIIPIKKDPLTKMTKGEVQKSTLALMRGRVRQTEKMREGFFKP